MKTVDELIAGDSVAPKPCHLLYDLPLGLALTISSQPTPATVQGVAVHVIKSLE